MCWWGRFIGLTGSYIEMLGLHTPPLWHGDPILSDARNCHLPRPLPAFIWRRLAGARWRYEPMMNSITLCMIWANRIQSVPWRTGTTSFAPGLCSIWDWRFVMSCVRCTATIRSQWRNQPHTVHNIENSWLLCLKFVKIRSKLLKFVNKIRTNSFYNVMNDGKAIASS